MQHPKSLTTNPTHVTKATHTFQWSTTHQYVLVVLYRICIIVQLLSEHNVIGNSDMYNRFNTLYNVTAIPTVKLRTANREGKMRRVKEGKG
jgi:hypothetical protein